MIVEAYTTIENTMKYYKNETQVRANMPFNFGLISELNDQSDAIKFSNVVHNWLDNMPKMQWPNWVVNGTFFRWNMFDCRSISFD